MYTLACQRIEEYRKGCDEGLSLTRGHLGYLALVKHYTTDELDVVMNHVPGDFIASGEPVVLPYGNAPAVPFLDVDKVMVDAEPAVRIACLHHDFRIARETSRGGLHYREGLREYFIENVLDFSVLVLDKLVRLSSEFLLLIDRNVLVEFEPDLGYPLLKRIRPFLNLFPECLSPGTELVIAESVYLPILCKDLLKDRFHLLHVPV